MIENSIQLRPFPFITLLLLFSMLSSSVFAHGEDKVGPNGGYIRMPGNFHTELLLTPTHVEVYLLDLQFQNPTTQNSTLEVVWSAKKNSKVNLACKAEADKFTCALPKAFQPNRGGLELRATRNQTPGAAALYTLPLKPWPKKSPQPMSNDEHSHHGH